MGDHVTCSNHYCCPSSCRPHCSHAPLSRSRMVELEAQIPERNTDQTQLPWFPNKARGGGMFGFVCWTGSGL